MNESQIVKLSWVEFYEAPTWLAEGEAPDWVLDGGWPLWPALEVPALFGDEEPEPQSVAA